MSVPKRPITGNTAPDCVIAWRTKRLSAAGLAEQLARSVAADSAYDFHALLELVDRGCPSRLALRILAPLDEQDRPC
jgi:hypothetical protein